MERKTRQSNQPWTNLDATLSESPGRKAPKKHLVADHFLELNFHPVGIVQLYQTEQNKQEIAEHFMAYRAFDFFREKNSRRFFC
jgi:hypothetical protein